MNDKTVFTKDKILFQSTLVKFRNGALGIAISDKTSENDHDGDEVFKVYDPENKMFISPKRLCCYDDNLRNELSLKGIVKKLDVAITSSSAEEVHEKSAGLELNDSEWDVVGVKVYPYAADAFRMLTSPEGICCWQYKINQ